MASGTSEAPIRVMVVDDSAVVRGLVSRTLSGDSGIEVLATASNGERALKEMERNDVEVIVLDLEMPVMDGLTAIPLLLKAKSHVKIIVSSALTMANAEVSMKCLQAGAHDVIAKPQASGGGREAFSADLIKRVKGLGEASRNDPNRSRAAKAAGRVSAAGASSKAATGKATGKVALGPDPDSIKLRAPSRRRPNALVIGSSTGGPQALFKFLGALNKMGPIRVPILLTQHMPKTFTTILATHLTRNTGITASEATDGERLQTGRIYVAPGDYHMTIEAAGTGQILRLNQDPPVNFCRPAVDPMFRSALEIYGANTLAVVLTGMGSDGSRSALEIANGGGTVIAQDEASSTVWGMPGATAQLGACAAVLPLDDIAAKVHELLNVR